MVQNYHALRRAILLLFIALLAISAVQAQIVVGVKETLLEGGAGDQEMAITSLGGPKTLTIPIPASAQGVYLDGRPVAPTDNGVVVTICKGCTSNITYWIAEAYDFSDQSDRFFQRTLAYSFSIDRVVYELTLPEGTFVKETQGEAAIAPAPSGIKTDGKHIIVYWVRDNPSLPESYVLHFSDEEVQEEEEFIAEFFEWPVWILVIVALCIGLTLGSLTRARKVADIHLVPLSLLSPDERTVLALLQKNKGTLGQKEMGQQLQWSKSKVSALMTALEHKRIIAREKLGRNYTVTLIKEIEQK